MRPFGIQRGAAWSKRERLPPQIPVRHSRLVAGSHLAGRWNAGLQGIETHVKCSALPHADGAACGCAAKSLDATASGADLCPDLQHSTLPYGLLARAPRDRFCMLAVQVSSIPDSNRTCSVLCSMPGRNRFMDCNDASNTFGGFYHVREPESQRLDMPLQEFLQCTQEWRSRPLYLKVTA
jgi:hypothetical protein